MKFDTAVAAEEEGDYERAASLYEEVIPDANAPLMAFVNLAVMYWQCTDPGLAASAKLSPSFIRAAAKRTVDVLQEARQRFPDRSEPLFWEKYIAWADFGRPFEINECRDLIRQDPTSLVPAMLIFSMSDGEEAASEAMELRRQMQETSTRRAKYVVSIVEAAAIRRTRRR